MLEFLISVQICQLPFKSFEKIIGIKFSKKITSDCNFKKLQKSDC